jgi:DNA-binding transcriptional LysR family regulator
MAGPAQALNWESVRYFLHAASTKSLSGAARSLRVEHTTVGRQLSQLERAVGASLVERSPSGLALTDVGQQVFQLALEMERAARAIAEVADSARANVRLVVPTGFAALLTPHLESLRREQPGILLELVSGARRVDLRKREADLAIRVGPVEDEELIARKLCEVGLALYGSRDYLARQQHEVDPDDLSGHALVGFHRKLAETPAAQWLAARAGKAHVVLRSREAVDMMAAVQAGVGLGVLPCFLADPERSLIRLTPTPIATRRVSLVYRRQPRLSAELRSVISLIVQLMRDQASRMLGVPSSD